MGFTITTVVILSICYRAVYYGIYYGSLSNAGLSGTCYYDPIFLMLVGLIYIIVFTVITVGFIYFIVAAQRRAYLY